MAGKSEAAPTLRTTQVCGPEVRRLNRARSALHGVRWAMLLLWGMILPLLLLLLLEPLLPDAVMAPAGYLLGACLLVPFGLWPVEHALERHEYKVRMRVFPRVETALSALQAGWSIEWSVPAGPGSKERLTSRGTWRQRYEWILDYSGDRLAITELAPQDHEDEDEP